MMVAFSHLDPGTPESVWERDSRLRESPALDPRVDDLVVVAAHPDDETLGAAGLIRRVRRDGGRACIVVLTDGAASHPDSPTHAPLQLSALRRDEVEGALAGLGEGVEIRFLDIPDGTLHDDVDGLTASVAAVLDELLPDRGDRALVVAPWSGDGHRDHRIAAQAVAAVCGPRGIRHLGYPIWLWHWGMPDDVPWERAWALRLEPDEVAAKRRAIVHHVSQVEPLSPAAGDEAIVHAAMRAHFERDVEIYLDERPAEQQATMSAAWFDAFYRRNDDPWGFQTRWYEERKRDLLLAVLPKAQLGVVLEIGCATGLVTRRLADRATRVLALDAAAAAVEAARRRIGADDRVTVSQGEVPRDWPPGEYDTIVLSEVGYYLSPADLARTVALAEDSLADDGCLVACHWRYDVAEYPQTGDAVHDALRSRAGWEVTVRHDERDFLLEVFSRRPARSVAQREGLA